MVDGGRAHVRRVRDRGRPHAGSHARQRVLPDGRDPCSRATSCSPGAIGRSDFPNSSPADMERSLGRFLELPGPDRRAARARSEDHRRARARAQPLPAGALSGAQAAAGDRRPPAAGLRRDARPVRGRPPDGAPVRVPLRRDADVRAHGAVRADVGRDLRRRDEGDVHVRGQGRAIAHAASRADGEHRPRVPGERPRPPDAVQGATTCRTQFRHGRPQAGGCASSGSSGSRRSGPPSPPRRRRGHRARRPVPAWSRALEGRAPRELDRRRRMPAGLPREADRVPRAARGGARRGLPDAASDQPAPGVRLQGRREDAARARRAR